MKSHAYPVLAGKLATKRIAPGMATCQRGNFCAPRWLARIVPNRVPQLLPEAFPCGVHAAFAAVRRVPVRAGWLSGARRWVAGRWRPDRDCFGEPAGSTARAATCRAPDSGRPQWGGQALE